MATEPIIPSRIIPAGAPLPPRPPEPGEAPPWRTPPAAPPAPPAQPPADWHRLPPDPQPIAVRVTVDMVYPEPAPEPSRWERLWAWVTSLARPWQISAALAAAMLPIPFTGYSTGTTWAYTISFARDEIGVPQAYGLALVPLLITGGVFLRTRRTLPLVALAICTVGVTGAIDLFDPVTALTGVRP
ncbi:hypothetical protein [Streptomyces niveus]|uniref:hypothetical protein n=1 Tax=Streptomyces niveus TaxID=193462 RepID=UPI00343E2597